MLLSELDSRQTWTSVKLCSLPHSELDLICSVQYHFKNCICEGSIFCSIAFNSFGNELNNKSRNYCLVVTDYYYNVSHRHSPSYVPSRWIYLSKFLSFGCVVISSIIGTVFIDTFYDIQYSKPHQTITKTPCWQAPVIKEEKINRRCSHIGTMTKSHLNCLCLMDWNVPCFENTVYYVESAFLLFKHAKRSPFGMFEQQRCRLDCAFEKHFVVFTLPDA